MKDLQMKRALRSVLIVLLLSVVGMMKMYAEVTIGNLTYSLSNSTLTATVTGHKDGTSATGELIIPEAVTYNGNTYTVTQIGNYAFNNCSGLTGSLTIPNSVTWIGGFAFHSCSGFSGSLTIPNSVTTMGGCVFSGCSGFTGRLTISNSIAIIGQMVFAGCTGLTSIEIPSSVTTIGAEAFASCNGLTSIEIPNSITTINSHAFSHCHGLTFVEISNSVTSIEGTAFSDCSGLGQIVVDSGNVVYDSRENCNAIIKTSNNELVVGCKYTVIPNSVTSIGDGAFYCCYGLTSIEIPNSVTSIGEGAFVGCSGLTSIEIPNSLTSIGGYAFRDCSGLTGSLTIPSSVTTIGDYAFYNCSGFTGNLIISNSVTTIGDSAFSGCIGFTGNLFIPNSVTYIGTNPFIDCTGLEHFIVDSGNTFYDSRENCNAIINTNTNELVAGCKYTFIPNSVTSIGSYAFSYCNSLTSIEIPNSVTSIGSYAFQYCDSLTSIEIPNSVTYIGEGAFYTCSGLTSIEFPNSVTSINNYLFMYCTRLNSIEIPNSVSYIGRYAFWDCTRLSSMSILADNPPTLDDNAFFGVNMRIPVYVPCESTEAYVAANWGSFNNFIGLCAGEITVIANPSEGGTVTGGGYYEGGATCTLTATANDGYSFINWTKNGVLVSYSDTSTFVVAGDASYVANFAQGVTITFADTNVKALCVANWDTDNDGELSYAEAADVTDLGAVFRNNRNLSSFDELQYFTGLTSVGDRAFANCDGLTSIEIPNSVITISSYAFAGCGLTSIEIPNSVTLIYDDAFAYIGSVEQIDVDSGNSVYDSRENCNAIIRTVTNKLVKGCKNTVIPNSVTSIGSYAFQNCNGLNSIEIPNFITSIESHAFEGCIGFTGSLIIPNSVSYIGMYAFQGCNRLTSVTIGNSVHRICYSAFQGCSELTSMIVLANNPPVLEDCAFARVNKSIPVYVPAGSIPTYQAASGWNEFTNYHEYAPTSYTITASANPAEGGSVTGVGTYTEGTTCTLIATANGGYNFVNWTENGQIVSTNATYSFTVTGDRSVVANFALSGTITNHWTPEGSSYSEIMAMYSVIQIDGVEQYSNTLEVGVFCGDECRGSAIASEFYLTHRYLAIMTIYGETGHQLTFKLYDHSTGQEYEPVSQETITFIEDGYGNPIEPYILNFNGASSGITQTISLAQGTNWFSTYVEITLDDLKAALETATPNTAITVQSQTQNTSYNPNNHRWTGRLTALDLSKMYKITVAASCEITLSGMLINPANHPVTISTGSNWIAFPIDENMTPTEAFAGFAVNGDVLQSQTNNANYRNNRWVGQVNTLEPGKGYIYRSSESDDRIFVFPQGRANQGLPSGLR